MNKIKDNIKEIKESLPKEVSLVAVSKTKPVSDLLEAYNAGQRIFGENKIQEMTQKWEEMPKDIEWHMIGHVQTNKVKYMAPYVSVIHAVDSLKLLQEIEKQAAKYKRTIDCLLQIKIAEEDSKYGLRISDAISILEEWKSGNYNHVQITGFMGMATFTENAEQLKQEFLRIQDLFDKTKKDFPSLHTLSIGMSGDYHIALEFGSTMVRIGSAIFGERKYQ